MKNQSLGEDVFVSQHYIESSPKDLFPFFSEAKNLEHLTPKSLSFKILKVSTSEIENGTLIDYSLKIHGVPVRWRTEIENWNPPIQFIDNQLKGPYKRWHHTHRFESLGTGTLMTDRVRFVVPFGFIGWVFSYKFIRSEIESIFRFRREIIHKLFHK